MIQWLIVFPKTPSNISLEFESWFSIPFTIEKLFQKQILSKFETQKEWFGIPPISTLESPIQAFHSKPRVFCNTCGFETL